MRRDQPAFSPAVPQTILELDDPQLFALGRVCAGQRLLVLASLASEPKGKWLAAWTTGGEILFFELKKGTRIARAELERRAAVHSRAVVGGGKRLVAASLSAAGLLDVESVGK